MKIAGLSTPMWKRNTAVKHLRPYSDLGTVLGVCIVRTLRLNKRKELRDAKYPVTD